MRIPVPPQYESVVYHCTSGKVLCVSSSTFQDIGSAVRVSRLPGQSHPSSCYNWFQHLSIFAFSFSRVCCCITGVSYSNDITRFIVVLLKTAVFECNDIFVAAGASRIGDCTDDVPAWLIALGVVQLILTIYIAVHYCKQGRKHSLGEHELPDLDSIFNRFCLLLCYVTSVLFLLFNWALFSAWKR